jgi:hypothetical protein
MGEIADWEFAAVVAAVCIGLGGLLILTLLGAIGAWRVHDAAAVAASEAARAATAVEELAHQLMTQSAQPAAQQNATLARHAEELERLTAQATELLAQQALLHDAVRNLVEAGVLRGDDAAEHLRQLEHTLRRVEEHLVRITTPGTR